MTHPPPPPEAPIAQWSAAIREDILANCGLARSSAIRLASPRDSLFTSLALHGIRFWPDLVLEPILEWASEPRRDRRSEELIDRDPDDIRHRTASARQIIQSAVRLGAQVPLLGEGGEISEFLNPPERPKRAPDDPAEIAAVVAQWRPQRWRHGSLRNLDAVLPEVRKRVLRAGPPTVHQARREMSVLTGFTLWARFDRHNDPVAMHTPDNVEVWVMGANADQDNDWQNRSRGALRRLGPTVNPAAWPRRPESIPRRGAAVPFDAKAEMQFRQAALLPRRDRRARMWVVIAAPGAGLTGTEIAAAHYDDLIERPDGRWEIHVRRDQRRVPIRRDYLPLVAELVAMQDRSRFIASEKPGAARLIAQRIRVGDRSLSLPTARNTFLAAHLEAGTPPAALSVIAGSVSHDTLDRLLEFVSDRLDPADAVEQALGA